MELATPKTGLVVVMGLAVEGDVCGLAVVPAITGVVAVVADVVCAGDSTVVLDSGTGRVWKGGTVKLEGVENVKKPGHVNPASVDVDDDEVVNMMMCVAQEGIEIDAPVVVVVDNIMRV
jgi:hypothetical protein